MKSGIIKTTICTLTLACIISSSAIADLQAENSPKDPSTPSLTLLTPGGGEVWNYDSTQTITWTSANLTGMVDIWYVPTGGTEYFYIDTVDVLSGTYDWPILLDISGPENQILLHWSDGTQIIQNTNDTPFELTTGPTPSLTLLDPAGGEIFTEGDMLPIYWESNFDNGIIHIDLEQNGHGIRRLASVPASDGVYVGHACPVAGSNTGYSIRISQDEMYLADSATNLTIEEGPTGNPVLAINPPLENITWGADSSHDIKWTQFNLNGMVVVHIENDSGYEPTHVAVPVENELYTWNIPADYPPGKTVITIEFDVCDLFLSDSAIITTLPPISIADIDEDGDVDLMDYEAIQSCLIGPREKLVPWLETCHDCDLSGDNDVDLEDFSIFITHYTGQ